MKATFRRMPAVGAFESSSLRTRTHASFRRSAHSSTEARFLFQEGGSICG